MRFLKFARMVPKRMNPRRLEKIMEELKNKKRTKIKNALPWVRTNLEIEDEFEEASKDLEIANVEIPAKEERLLRVVAQVGKSHRIDVSCFISSLHLEEPIDWVIKLV